MFRTAKTSSSGRLLVFGIAAVVIVALLTHFFFGARSHTVEAQVAVLYASSCLGGWKNPDLVTGPPDVRTAEAAVYTEDNSAVLKNTQTQLFCGGFSGTIPENVDRTKISVRFSWEAVGGDDYKSDSSKNNDSDDPGELEVKEETVTASSSDEAASTTENIAPEILIPEEAPDTPQVQEEPRTEQATEPETASILPWFVSVAQAEEVEMEEQVKVEDDRDLVIEDETVMEVGLAEDSLKVNATNTASSTKADDQEEIIASTTASTTESKKADTILRAVNNEDKDNALFEVLFTTDNEVWHVLGYVPRINNDIQFELPLDMFDSVDDFDQLQISLKTLERFDDTPTIYLDSMWVEVSYVDAGQDPLSPPGSLPGDIVVRKVSTEESSLVTVFRNTSLETLSNILLLQASSTPAAATSTVATSTATTTALSVATTSLYANASSTIVLFEADIPRETKDLLRATPGVLVELWLHNRLTDSWTRVADNSIVATEPYATVFDKKVFWFDPNMASLWMFDALSGGYTSQSFTVGELVQIEFTHSSNKLYTVKFDDQKGELVPLKKEMISDSE
jgi:hypothetical protein